MIPAALRRARAHVLVGDVAAPVLDSAAAHHLTRVLRLGDGAAVTVTDGAGSWSACTLAGGGLDQVADVEFIARRKPPVTIAVAPPKGERLEWLVAKATELGVDRIVLIDAERSVVRLKSDRAERQLERLRRIATEASMQSRRVWLPEIVGPEPAAAWLNDGSVAEPGGRRVNGGDTTVVIGPEGGWSDDELAAVPVELRVSLGDTVLRVETAAIAAATLLVGMAGAPR